MIFVTVGTVVPFDRLVRAVDEAAGAGIIDEEMFAQVGRGGYRPKHMPWSEALERDVFGEYMARADRLIAHAGTGTIFEALEAGKPLLVMPRLRRYGEIVNDHQVGTARRFGELGHVLVAEDEGEIAGKVGELGTFVPRAREVDGRAVVERVRGFLAAVAQAGGNGREGRRQ